MEAPVVAPAMREQGEAQGHVPAGRGELDVGGSARDLEPHGQADHIGQRRGEADRAREARDDGDRSRRGIVDEREAGGASGARPRADSGAPRMPDPGVQQPHQDHE